MRETCLYCAEDGIETPLVKIGTWGCCPIHSKEYIKASNWIPEGYALVKKPVLLTLGIPERRNYDIKEGSDGVPQD